MWLFAVNALYPSSLVLATSDNAFASTGEFLKSLTASLLTSEDFT